MDTREHDIRLYTDHLNFILHILKILIYSNKIKKPGVHFNNDMNEGFGFSCFYSYVQCMSKQIEKKSEVGFNKSTGIWHVQLGGQESCEAGLLGQSEAVQEITCQLDSKYSRNRQITPPGRSRLAIIKRVSFIKHAFCQAQICDCDSFSKFNSLLIMSCSS